MRIPRNLPKVSATARSVLEKRYLLRDEKGRTAETPRELFERVAGAVAQAETRDRKRWSDAFFELMVRGRFLPNSPTLMNAGLPSGQLSACFVLPIEDTLESIFETLKDAARIHQSGGGTGFSFSRVRPKGSMVRSNRGVASGPVSFLRIYDMATETIKQGGTRCGANMGILRVDHPDIIEFVDSKRDMRSIVNFNISVGITEPFMEAVKAKEKYHLLDPRDGKRAGELDAREVFDRIVRAAWECGDPGLVFLDQINRFNPTPKAGAIEATNPCGEQPLLPYESCNLGSLNLGAYVQGRGGRREIDWKRLRQDVWTAVRFLDDVIEVNTFPLLECDRITRKNRKIGLGVMGFADALLLLGVRYDSEEGRAVGERFMSFIDDEGKKASTDLAKKRGPFPNWKGSRWQKQGMAPLRNATVTTVAPTGTISLIAGASSGIEPIYSSVIARNVLEGERLVEVHPTVARLFEEAGLDLGGAAAAIAGDVRGERAREVLGSAWRTAAEVAVEDHVLMQAAFQRHSDSAVSKTINLPHDATEEAIARAYLLAYEHGCKGITVYRDRSRPTQVLTVGSGSGQECRLGSDRESCPAC